MINYGKQFLDKRDISQVLKVLKSNFLTQGPQVKKFENSLKNYFGAKFCSVVSNGTAALHLAARTLDFKKGDYIFTTPNSFLATSNCIIYSNATPVFVDIDKDTYNIDINKLETKIKLYKKKKRRVKAIIATDYAGHPCDWKKLHKIKKKYKLGLINDNCHSMGASYFKSKKYAVKYADVVTHSYHPVKNITSGEGGAILTNNKKINEKIKLLRSHGYKKNINKHWHYDMTDLGYNYRLSDLNCALGDSQLRKLNLFVKRRIKIAKIYDKEFSGIDHIYTPKVNKNVNHAYHIYPLRINFKKFKIDKSFFLKKMKSKNVNLQVHYIPIFNQPYYKKRFKVKKKEFKIVSDFYSQEVSLPMYFSLKDTEVNYVVKHIKDILKI